VWEQGDPEFTIIVSVRKINFYLPVLYICVGETNSDIILPAVLVFDGIERMHPGMKEYLCAIFHSHELCRILFEESERMLTAIRDEAGLPDGMEKKSPLLKEFL